MKRNSPPSSQAQTPPQLTESQQLAALDAISLNSQTFELELAEKLNATALQVRLWLASELKSGCLSGNGAIGWQLTALGEGKRQRLRAAVAAG